MNVCSKLSKFFIILCSQIPEFYVTDGFDSHFMPHTLSLNTDCIFLKYKGPFDFSLNCYNFCYRPLAETLSHISRSLRAKSAFNVFDLGVSFSNITRTLKRDFLSERRRHLTNKWI